MGLRLCAILYLIDRSKAQIMGVGGGGLNLTFGTLDGGRSSKSHVKFKECSHVEFNFLFDGLQHLFLRYPMTAYC